ncbi:MAG: glycoside hydrolase family 127 protein [Clostridia bacterium]|nr:glycoside hydrolase family 127 protein [Clostridia bacterium]
MLTRTFFARAPLAPGRFAPLPAGAISAQGALRERLISLRAGLLSRCASLFPEVGEQSAWFGGDLPGGIAAADALEASLLTAALLGDEELRRDSLRLVRRVVDAQREDGGFGAQGESFAARGRMLRALGTAYSMTGDKRVLTFMLRYMKYLRDTLRSSPLSAEDAMHTADTLEAGIFLYNVTGQKAVLSVLMMLVSQGADYTSLLHAFPYRAPLSRTMSVSDILRALEAEDETGYTHHLLRQTRGDNLCEGLRVSALCGVLTGSGKHLSAPEIGLARLNKAHGAACGGITADPQLAGTHPSRGVSATSVCELAASLETLLSCPGGEHGADQLETLLYNAVDAAFSPDGRSVQPIQQANQVLLSRADRFPLSGDGDGLFSLSDARALCALLAAWPRFAQHQWMVSRDDGLCAMSYAPCRVNYRLGETSVRLTVSSRYPVSGSVRIAVSLKESAAFPIHLRIPEWAKGASAAVCGDILPAVPGSFLTVNRQWHDGDEILLTLPMAPATLPSFHQAVSVMRGPLRFAYAPEAEETAREGAEPVWGAKEGFGVALLSSHPIEAEESEDGVLLRARGIRVPRWGLRASSCDQPPIALSETGEEIALTLVPYAKAAIRLAVLPTAQ